MPEGHILHRLARDLSERIVGDVVRASSPQKRFSQASELDGRTLVDASAWGKHLVLAFDDARFLHAHLGLRGVPFVRGPDAAPISSARVRLVGPRASFDLVAPLVCELVDRARVDALVTALGPDPLRDDADEGAFAAALSTRMAIGAVVMDQARVSGVGNVFRAEVLHRLGIHPRRPAESLDAAERHALWRTLREVMARAVEDGRIITVDTDERATIPEQDARFVYKQERCRRCGAAVETATLAGRTSYVCPSCQRLGAGA